MTDYTGINEMIDHGMGDQQTVAALALNAGVDMDMVSDAFSGTLKKSVEEGKMYRQLPSTPPAAAFWKQSISWDCLTILISIVT